MTAAELAEQIFVSNKPTTHRKADIDLCITTHVLDVINSCHFNFPTCHNILWNVFKKYVRLRINQHPNAIISNNTYASPAWWGFTNAVDRNRQAVRHGYCADITPTLSSFCNKANQTLFDTATHKVITEEESNANPASFKAIMGNLYTVNVLL